MKTQWTALWTFLDDWMGHLTLWSDVHIMQINEILFLFSLKKSKWYNDRWIYWFKFLLNNWSCNNNCDNRNLDSDWLQRRSNLVFTSTFFMIYFPELSVSLILFDIGVQRLFVDYKRQNEMISCVVTFVALESILRDAVLFVWNLFISKMVLFTELFFQPIALIL